MPEQQLTTDNFDQFIRMRNSKYSYSERERRMRDQVDEIISTNVKKRKKEEETKEETFIENKNEEKLKVSSGGESNQSEKWEEE